MDPHPAVRETLAAALTADRASFREQVATLAAEHGFGVDRLETTPDTFDPPAAICPVADPDRPLVWRAWTLAQAPIGVVLAGAAYRGNPVLYANRATRQLTGYTLEELAGENLRLLQGPDTAKKPVADLREALLTWNGVTVELRNYRADGTPFENRVTLVPVPDADGTVSHWFGLQAAVPTE